MKLNYIDYVLQKDIFITKDGKSDYFQDVRAKAEKKGYTSDTIDFNTAYTIKKGECLTTAAIFGLELEGVKKPTTEQIDERVGMIIVENSLNSDKLSVGQRLYVGQKGYCVSLSSFLDSFSVEARHKSLFDLANDANITKDNQLTLAELTSWVGRRKTVDIDDKKTATQLFKLMYSLNAKENIHSTNTDLDSISIDLKNFKNNMTLDTVLSLINDFNLIAKSDVSVDNGVNILDIKEMNGSKFIDYIKPEFKNIKLGDFKKEVDAKKDYNSTTKFFLWIQKHCEPGTINVLGLDITTVTDQAISDMIDKMKNDKFIGKEINDADTMISLLDKLAVKLPDLTLQEGCNILKATFLLDCDCNGEILNRFLLLSGRFDTPHGVSESSIAGLFNALHLIPRDDRETLQAKKYISDIIEKLVNEMLNDITFPPDKYFTDGEFTLDLNYARDGYYMSKKTVEKVSKFDRSTFNNSNILKIFKDNCNFLKYYLDNRSLDKTLAQIINEIEQDNNGNMSISEIAYWTMKTDRSNKLELPKMLKNISYQRFDEIFNLFLNDPYTNIKSDNYESQVENFNKTLNELKKYISNFELRTVFDFLDACAVLDSKGNGYLYALSVDIMNSVKSKNWNSLFKLLEKLQDELLSPNLQQNDPKINNAKKNILKTIHIFLFNSEQDIPKDVARFVLVILTSHLKNKPNMLDFYIRWLTDIGLNIAQFITDETTQDVLKFLKQPFNPAIDAADEAVKVMNDPKSTKEEKYSAAYNAALMAIGTQAYK